MGQLNDYSAIARWLIDQDRRVHNISLSELSRDPFAQLDAHPSLEVIFEEQRAYGCSVAGYFRENSVPPALVVHPSGAYRRDAFTLLHEYGHYLQLAHSEWTDILYMRPDARGTKHTGERVADHVASEVLLPRSTLSFESDLVSARELRDLYLGNTTASRSAIAHRVAASAGPASRIMVAVLGEWGQEVLFARSTGDLMAPGRGIEQPDLEKLIRRAAESDSGTALSFGDPAIVARSGWQQSDLRVEVAVDADGYAFAIGRAAKRYGPTWWSKDQSECGNESCGALFSVAPGSARCSRCDDFHCPECGTCDSPSLQEHTCPQCRMLLSSSELADPGSHECW